MDAEDARDAYFLLYGDPVSGKSGDEVKVRCSIRLPVLCERWLTVGANAQGQIPLSTLSSAAAFAAVTSLPSSTIERKGSTEELRVLARRCVKEVSDLMERFQGRVGLYATRKDARLHKTDLPGRALCDCPQLSESPSYSPNQQTLEQAAESAVWTAIGLWKGEAAGTGTSTEAA